MDKIETDSGFILDFGKVEDIYTNVIQKGVTFAPEIGEEIQKELQRLVEMRKEWEKEREKGTTDTE